MIADKSTIEWTDATWQVASGCSPASAGCRNCYSATLAGTRLKHTERCAGLTREAEDGRHVWTGEVRLHPDQLDVPLRWRKPRRIFVGERTDLFHPAIPDDYIDRVWAVMALTPQHTYQILTKRPERMREYLSAARAHPVGLAALDITLQCPPGSRVGAGVMLQGDIAHLKVWLGVSIEDQTTADARIPDLLATPAAVRWVSAEPLLGSANIVAPGTEGSRLDALRGAYHCEGRNEPWPTGCLSWVVVGGESGPHARPMRLEWVRVLLRQTKSTGVPTFVKQLGARCIMDRNDAVQSVALGAGWRALKPGTDLGEVSFRQHKGADMTEWPKDVRVQEMPS